MATEHAPIVVIGAGFAGIGLAVKLQEAGIDGFVLLEKASAPGGVWRDNTYPGCACDVPSALYSYSFAQNPDWSRAYATQPEILAYLQRVAREHDVERFARFDTELLDARWDDRRRRWRLRTSGGPLTAGVLIGAMGLFGDAPTRAGAVIHGRDGRSLVDIYDERPQSYLGTSYAGFPNFFTVLGPYGAAGNQSAIYMIERQIGYIVDALKTLRADDVAVVEVRPQAQADFLEDVDRRSESTVWVNGGCRSYYQTADGHNSGLWPNWSFVYARRARRFDPAAYDLTPAPTVQEAARAAA